MTDISIITVTFNCVDSIAKTIESLKEQTFNRYEHIIVDGASKDGTTECIKEYIASGYCVTFVSEPDQGIYDAMNKGIGMASGKYLFFLNAGDSFCDKYVLQKFWEYEENNRVDVFYGDTIEINIEDGENDRYRSYPEKLSNCYFLKRNGLCHQTIFAKKECFTESNFNWQSYPITADKEWVIRLWRNGKVFLHMDFPVCFYDRTGISSNKQNAMLIREETDRIIFENFGIFGKFVTIVRNFKSRLFK